MQNTMNTPWGENILLSNTEKTLTEYPRPQMQRNSYLSLNGFWNAKIIRKAVFDELTNNGNNAPKDDEGFEKIRVPFSPEAELSSFNKTLYPNRVIIYKKFFSLTKSFNIGRVILHLDAVDNRCDIFLNGKKLISNVGGYIPIIVDITDFLVPNNELIVCASDSQENDFLARGKQKIDRGGIWYTAQSGIWQSVWIESVPKEYITGLKLTPDIDNSLISITVLSDCSSECTVFLLGKSYLGKTNEPIIIPIDMPIYWSPELPHLYYFTAKLKEDSVKSYFAMRKFSVGTDKNGIKRLLLNNIPYFHNGLLDQGYWSDGLLTPPCDEAMIYDITSMKKMGFNMLRKHIKIEPLRWYYHCDRLGMLVWQDFVSGGDNVHTPDYDGTYICDNDYKAFGRDKIENRESYYSELKNTVTHLYNSPCIAMWVPFNEGWGQFDALKATDEIKKQDTTRTIDHASGWHDQGGSDVYSVHVYFVPYKFRADPKELRAVVLSEFGGYNCRINNHSFSRQEFGYMKITTTQQLIEALSKLYNNEIIPAVKKGLCAAVYTQVSDVEDELNGLITYDRQVVKVDEKQMRKIVAPLSGKTELS